MQEPKLISLSMGRVAIVDAEDYEWLSKHRWFCHKQIDGRLYAQRQGLHRRAKKIIMHIEIMNPPPGLLVDHKDGNGLNNRRSNLRLATYSQNSMNARVNKNSKSGYKGVTLHKDTGKWTANIRYGGRQRYLGLFTTKEEAAEAYNRAAREHHGEFAFINKISEDPHE